MMDESWMMISLLTESFKLHEIDQFDYVKDVLTRLPSASTGQIDQLLPDRWKNRTD
jgi:hypothetical protein